MALIQFWTWLFAKLGVALRRLERDGLIRSQWEKQTLAEEELRPARKYYKLTRPGKQAVAAALERYPLLAKLVPASDSASTDPLWVVASRCSATR